MNKRRGGGRNRWRNRGRDQGRDQGRNRGRGGVRRNYLLENYEKLIDGRISNPWKGRYNIDA